MRVPILISALLAAATCCAVAQQANKFHIEVSQVQDRMTSSKWRERRAALDDAFTLLSTKRSAADADKLRLGIIQLLDLEQRLAKQPVDVAGRKLPDDEDVDEPADSTLSPGAWTEERGDYFADLIGAVASLNDERAIPVLLNVSTTGGMATQGVARFGRIALAATLEHAKSLDRGRASGALFVIRDMLRLHTANDPDSLLRIKIALRAALASPAWNVRSSAIYAVESLDDRDEFVPILKELAEHDPFKLPGQPREDGSIGDHYFVRHSAKMVLESIAKKERPPAPLLQGR